MLQLHADKLVKEEIVFELLSRGVHIDKDANVRDLSKLLKEILALEKEGKSFRCDFEFNPTDELKIVESKLNDIKTLLEGEISQTSIRRIESKLCHTLNRVEHINATEKIEIESRAKLLNITLKFISDFKEKSDSYKQKLKSKDPLDIIFQGNPSTPQSNTSNCNVQTSTPHGSPSAGGSNPTCSQVTLKMFEQLSLGERANISNWGLRFSGESNMGLNYFLERVDELCIARNINKDYLFKSAIELFEGKALVWYRSIKNNVSDWDTLCLLLRDEFLPRDYNEKLWSQIKSRTQGTTESIGIFMAYMNNLFNRLTTQVSEDIKLKIIRKNILPFYQEKLMLTEIYSQDQLLELCRKLEEARDSVQNFIPPESKQDKLLVVEPDLAYTKPSKKKIDNIEIHKPVVTFEKDQINTKSSIKEAQSTGHESKLRAHDYDRDNRRNRSQDSLTGRNRSSSRDRSTDSRYSNNSQKRDINNSSDRYRNSRDRNRHTNSDRFDNENRSRDRYRDHRYRNYSRDGSNDRNRSYSRSSSRNRRDNYRNSSNDRFRNSRSNQSRDRYNGDRYNRDRSNDNRRTSNSYNSPSREITCYKCQGKNHLARHCTVKQCGNCKRLNVTRYNCPSCVSGNGRRNCF